MTVPTKQILSRRKNMGPGSGIMIGVWAPEDVPPGSVDHYVNRTAQDKRPAT